MKNLGNKSKNRQMGLHQNKKLLHSKEKYFKNLKEQFTGFGK
jgi:hypothetical protein